MDAAPLQNRADFCFDLHSHSDHSDGLLSPSALLARARAQGVDVLALTDHDSTDGLGEARRAADAAGILLIDGVEISVSWQDHLIHVVALGIDPSCPELQAGLAAQRSLRIERAERIAAKLDGLGIPGSLAGAARHAGTAAPGRNHFARFLVENGHARHARQAFKRFLGRGGRCHVPCHWASLETALSWSRAARGQAVLAHPARYGLSRTALRRFLAEFRATGGVAIEVISGWQAPEQTRDLARLARDAGLLASVGSDFHAPDAVWAELGRLPPLPSGCVPVWHDWPVAAADRRHRASTTCNT
jgi:3',5'-nucleoside bisphosphate phosphatase